MFQIDEKKVMDEIEPLVQACDNIGAALKVFAEELLKLLKKEVKPFLQIAKLIDDETKRKKENQFLKSNWIVPKDLRIPSQVFDNKPRFLFRKVIR